MRSIKLNDTQSAREALKFRLSGHQTNDYSARVALSIARELNDKPTQKLSQNSPRCVWQNFNAGVRAEVTSEWADLVFAAKSLLLATNFNAIETVAKRIWRALCVRSEGRLKETDPLGVGLVVHLASAVISGEAIRENGVDKQDLRDNSLPARRR